MLSPIPSYRMKAVGAGAALRRTSDGFDLIAAASVSAGAMSIALLRTESLLHWMILPLWVCGVLIGADASAWLRGRLDIFDPAGLVGAYGYYFFFVAPLLTVALKFHNPAIPECPDWREWIGWMAIINCAGLVIYRIAVHLFRSQPVAAVWRIHRARFVQTLTVAVPVAFAMQVYIFARFGGVWGFMQTFTEGNRSFDGMGWQFVVADAVPYLLALFVLVRFRETLRRAPWPVLLGLLAGFFLLKLLCGGLRGSRSHTIWGMFWLVGAIHFWVKPVPRKLVVIGLGFLVTFMFAYGLYKAQGTAAFDSLQSREVTEDAITKSGRTFSATLLADMARTDVQAYLLYRLSSVREYDLVHGATYISACGLILPKALRPEWLVTKTEAGTEALYGRDSFNSITFSASQVYGLTGEAMLNFPIWTAPLAFVALAFAVAKIRSLMMVEADDLRRLVLPFLVNCAFLIISSDLDNLVVFFITSASSTAIVLGLSLRSTSSSLFLSRGAQLPSTDMSPSASS